MSRRPPSFHLGPIVAATCAFLGASLASGGALGVALSGCGAADGTTSGQRVVLSGTASRAGGTSFDTRAGWRVELSRAVVSVGALAYFDGEPLFVRASPGRAPSRSAAFDVVRSAFAHPGHYVPGAGRGETPAGAVVDLLGPPVDLPVGSGVTGAVRSATFRFGASLVDGGVVALAGTATRTGETRAFSVVLGSSDVADGAGEPEVVGCVVRAPEIAGDAHVALTVDPSVVLADVDFADAPPAGASSAALGPSSVARRGIVRGLRSARAYAFSLE